MWPSKPVWTLENGLELVRAVQLGSRNFNYHVALGGGVLNNGTSKKDCDVYFLPLDNGDPSNHLGLLGWLFGQWGAYEDIQNEHYVGESFYAAKVKFSYQGRRIDAFIAKGEAA